MDGFRRTESAVSPSLSGPGRASEITIDGYAAQVRPQELLFDAARDLTRHYGRVTTDSLPAHVVFPQMLEFVRRYVRDKVEIIPPARLVQLFMGHYYGYLLETLLEAVRPEADGGEAAELPVLERSRPDGSTAEVSFWTSRDVREVTKSHVNYVVADTKRWEQSAAFEIDRHPNVQAFVKNAGLGMAIPYQHNGEPHDFIPDFLIRWKVEGPPRMLILETKGYDPLAEVKRAAALRWVAAVDAAASHGNWAFAMARQPGEVRRILDAGSDR